jgi:hypothetical protein
MYRRYGVKLFFTESRKRDQKAFSALAPQAHKNKFVPTDSFKSQDKQHHHSTKFKMEDSRISIPAETSGFLADKTIGFTRAQSYSATAGDLDLDYAQIMEICEPFYELPNSVDNGVFRIPPRLEDGLFMTENTTFNTQENPQDAMCCQQDRERQNPNHNCGDNSDFTQSTRRALFGGVDR